VSVEEPLVNPALPNPRHQEENRGSTFGFWKQAIAFIFLILMSYDGWVVIASIVTLGQYFTFELSHWIILGGLLFKNYPYANYYG